MKSVTPGIVLLFLCAGAVPARDEPPAVAARTTAEVKKKLAAIAAREGPAGEHGAVLRRLNSYRYLAGVPDDVTLDDDHTAAAEAGARLLAKLGRLDHTPDNPGLPEDEYKLGYKGTSRSNLGQGYRSLEKALDGWMEDSDPGNIAHLGHRRWCLNPAMQKTGFGRTGEFTVMYSFDRGRREVPDYDFVSWPPRGPVPVEFFDKVSAWSVSPNPKAYNPAGDGVTAKVYAADATGAKTGDPLKLNHHGTNTDGFGVPNCVIFRPEKAEIAPGKRYVVEINGLTRGRDNAAAEVRFAVEFISIK